MENELYHWSSSSAKKGRKGVENKKHKYVAKVEEKKRTRYFYTKDEWLAYLKNKNSPKTKPIANGTAKATNDAKITTKKVADSKITGTKSNKETTSITGKRTSSSFESLAKLGKSFIEALIGKDSKNAVEEAENVKKASTETANTVKDEAARKKANEEATKKADEERRKKIAEEAKKSIAETEAKAKKIRDEADAVNLENSPKSWDELDLKDREYTDDEDQAVINPYYVSDDEMSSIWEQMTHAEREEFLKTQDSCGVALAEYTINCQSCTLAYDMRQRGYDVEAAPYDMNESWYPDHEGISMWYEGVTTDDWSRFELDYNSMSETKGYYDLVDDMYAGVGKTFDAMPDGSYGQFCVRWSLGGGHSIVWEKNNGKVTLRDCQTNETLDFDKISSDERYYGYVGSVQILRTDDKKFTDAALRRVRNADHVEEIDTYFEKMREKYGKETSK